MSFVVDDDPAETANNIMANEGLFIGANVVWIISEMFWLFLGFVLYLVLRPVHKDIALLFFVLVAVGVAMECLNTLNQIAVVELLSGADYLAVFTTDQVNAQVMHQFDLNEKGYNINAIVSFGPWLVPAGYLIYRSGYFPKILGILVMLGGIGIFYEGLVALLAPNYPEIAIPGSILGILGEFTLAGWLLVKGANVPSEVADEEDKEEMVVPNTETGPEG
jgi:hypothetical protein